MPPLHAPVTCRLSVRISVSATCPWNMTLRICLPWLDTPWGPWKTGVHLTTCNPGPKFREVRPFNWAGHTYFPVSRRMEGAHSCRYAFFLCHSTFFSVISLNRQDRHCSVCWDHLWNVCVPTPQILLRPKWLLHFLSWSVSFGLITRMSFYWWRMVQNTSSVCNQLLSLFHSHFLLELSFWKRTFDTLLRQIGCSDPRLKRF